MKTRSIDRWEQIEKDPPKTYQEFFLQEREFLEKNVSTNSLVLDVGCGDGRIIRILSNICNKMIGIDNDKESIKKCKDNLSYLSNVEIFLEGAEKTHFEDNFFDVVICFSLFENLAESKLKILSEIRRILKDKGILIASFYNEDALEDRLNIYHKIEKEEFSVDNKGKVTFNEGLISEQFSKRDIKNLLSKVGFEIEEIIKGKIFYLIKAKKKQF